MDWREIYGNWVVIPARPIGVIHFLGGAFVAAAPQITYRALLEDLASQGYVVVATPFVNTFDHAAIATQVLENFDDALNYLQAKVLKQQYLPIYGMGHSMGCKLHLLIGSMFPQERAGNILISFNNFSAKRSVPLLDQINQLQVQIFAATAQLVSELEGFQGFDIEFTPTPEQTNRLILDKYQVKRNLLIKFRNDDIDQTQPLIDILQQRFPTMTSVELLQGNHLTPLGQDLRWQAGSEFSALDAIAQFVKQEIYRDFNQLKRKIAVWLNPLKALR
jgi:hypothetical protein